MKIQQAIDSGELFIVGTYMFPGKAERRTGKSAAGRSYDMASLPHTILTGSGENRATTEVLEVFDVSPGTPEKAPLASQLAKLKEGEKCVAFVTPRADKRTQEIGFRLTALHPLEQ